MKHLTILHDNEDMKQFETIAKEMDVHLRLINIEDGIPDNIVGPVYIRTGARVHLPAIEFCEDHPSTKIINSKRAIEFQKDRYHSYQRLIEHKFYPPTTAQYSKKDNDNHPIKEYFKLPLAIKPNCWDGGGTQIIKELDDEVTIPHSFDDIILIQRYIHSQFEPLRVEIVNGKVVCGVINSETVGVDPVLAQHCESFARCEGLDVCTMKFIYDNSIGGEWRPIDVSISHKIGPSTIRAIYGLL